YRHYTNDCIVIVRKDITMRIASIIMEKESLRIRFGKVLSIRHGNFCINTYRRNQISGRKSQITNSSILQIVQKIRFGFCGQEI
ncbi:MAG: hypothetical protein ACR2IS_06830, partial [Nitrososphaeraceae archaeon]